MSWACQSITLSTTRDLSGAFYFHYWVPLDVDMDLQILEKSMKCKKLRKWVGDLCVPKRGLKTHLCLRQEIFKLLDLDPMGNHLVHWFLISGSLGIDKFY